MSYAATGLGRVNVSGSATLNIGGGSRSGSGTPLTSAARGAVKVITSQSGAKTTIVPKLGGGIQVVTSKSVPGDAGSSSRAAMTAGSEASASAYAAAMRSLYEKKKKLIACGFSEKEAEDIRKKGDKALNYALAIGCKRRREALEAALKAGREAMAAGTRASAANFGEYMRNTAQQLRDCGVAQAEISANLTDGKWRTAKVAECQAKLDAEVAEKVAEEMAPLEIPPEYVEEPTTSGGSKALKYGLILLGCAAVVGGTIYVVKKAGSKRR